MRLNSLQCAYVLSFYTFHIVSVLYIIDTQPYDSPYGLASDCTSTRYFTLKRCIFTQLLSYPQFL